MDFSAPFTYAFLAAYFLCSSFSAAAGMGGGMMLMGLMGPLFPPAILIPLHGALMLSSNATRAALFWRHIPWPLILPLCLGLFIGSLTGGHFALSLPPHVVQVIIATTMLTITWMRGPTLPPKWSRNLHVVVGTIHGFIGTVAGTAGLVQSVIGRQRISKQARVVSVAVCSMVLHILKIIIFTAAGVSLAPYLGFIGVSIAIGVAGTWFGKVVLDKLILDIWFDRLFKAIITMLACNLLLQASRLWP